MKKKVTSRVAAILLSLVMCLSCIVVPSYAATYTDVSASSWYYTYVSYVSDKGYMNGIGDNVFDPEGTLTRGMFVTVLYRMSEDYGDYAGADSGFSDVEVGAWFSDAIAWAVDNGVTDGTSPTTFSPDMPVTREQMATFVARYLAAYDITLEEVENPVSGFGDIGSVSSWALSSVETMRLTGIIEGDNGNFRPIDTASRAEAATIFYRIDMALTSGDIEYYTVTYVLPNGATCAETVEAGTTELMTPTYASGMLENANDVFEGWYTDADCTNAFSGAITADITLYAKVTTPEPVTYTVTYILPNGSTYTETVEAGTTELMTPTYASGMLENATDVFEGWYTDAGYTNAFSGAVTSDITLYAKVTAASVDSCKILTVGGTNYYLGESVSSLGTPDETLSSTFGFTWYVYGTDDYTDFVAAGVKDGVVVSLVSAGVGFTYQGMSCGDALTSYTTGACYITIATDQNDSYIVHGVQLTSYGYSSVTDVSANALAGESKLNFHLTNAFRVYHGLNTLTWSGTAATAARLHSQDMADQNYFSHTSLDGRTPSERMAAQGIQWFFCGENIAAGYPSGFSVYNGWVNSSGHRTNMLQSYYTYLGVGGGYSASSTYGIYFTQDFYS